MKRNPNINIASVSTYLLSDKILLMNSHVENTKIPLTEYLSEIFIAERPYSNYQLHFYPFSYLHHVLLLVSMTLVFCITCIPIIVIYFASSIMRSITRLMFFFFSFPGFICLNHLTLLVIIFPSVFPLFFCLQKGLFEFLHPLLYIFTICILSVTCIFWLIKNV